MGDRQPEQPNFDVHGILPPRAYAIDVRDAPGGVVVLVLDGELDLAAAPELAERLTAARDGGAPGVVLDMTEVTFVDSSALRELLNAASAYRAAGTPLVLAAAPDSFGRLIELTRTADALAVVSTVEQALERVAAG